MYIIIIILNIIKSDTGSVEAHLIRDLNPNNLDPNPDN